MSKRVVSILALLCVSVVKDYCVLCYIIDCKYLVCLWVSQYVDYDTSWVLYDDSLFSIFMVIVFYDNFVRSILPR